MLQIILLELVAFGIAWACDYFSWGSLSSEAFAMSFGPRPDEGEDASLEERRKRGYISEVTRSFELMVISLIILLLFSRDGLLVAILQNRLLCLGIVVLALYGVFHYCYIGPRRLAVEDTRGIRLLSAKGFREYFVPYLVSLPGFYAVVFGMIGVAVVAVIYGIGADLRDFVLSVENIRNVPGNSLADIQYAVVRLVEFGEWTTSASQKYVVISILAFLFVIFEQRSTLRHTIWLQTLDSYKILIWFVFFLTLGFGVIYLPAQYQSLHAGLRSEVMAAATGYKHFDEVVQADLLVDVLDLQNHLEEHRLGWLILNIVTGYGNLAALVLVGGGFLLRRILPKEIPTAYILSLVLPSYVMKRLTDFLDRVGMKL